MSRKLVVAPEAAAQIIAAVTWWNENREKAPALLEEELDRAFDLLVVQPTAGSVSRNARFPSLRRVLLRKTRYHLYYLFESDALEVKVVGLWHAERMGPDW